MAYLTLTPLAGGAATTIRVLVSSPPPQRGHDVGSITRAFDGTPHDTRRARPRMWSGVHTIVTAAAGSTLKLLLEGPQPLTAAGDLTGGAVPVYISTPEIVGVIPGYVRVRFDMWANE